MSRRFLASIIFVDLAVLLAAMVVGSLVVLESTLPWESVLIRGSVGTTLTVLLGGAAFSEYIAFKVLTTTVPRPSYARVFLVVIGTYMSLAVYITLFRPWYSLGFLAVTGGAWLSVMVLHRFVLRLSPWSESMVIITANESAVDEINSSPHATIRKVLDPQSGHVPDPLGEGTGLVIDFGISFSDKVGQFISSSLLTGTNVRALTSVYEEHTGKLPLTHLAEGWEISQLVQRNRSYGPLKRLLDLSIVALLIPVSILVGIPAAIAVKLSSPGPMIYRQPRVGRGTRPFTLYKLRTMFDELRWTILGSPRWGVCSASFASTNFHSYGTSCGAI